MATKAGRLAGSMSDKDFTSLDAVQVGPEILEDI
jgi:hypothetical protein